MSLSTWKHRKDAARDRRRNGRRHRGGKRSAQTIGRTRGLRLEPLEQRTVLSVGGLNATVFENPDDDGVQSPREVGQPDFVPGEILVGFEGEVPAAYRANGAAAALDGAAKLVRAVGLHNPAVLMDVPAAVNHPARLATRWQLPDGADVLEMVQQLSDRSGIAYAEPNYILSIDATPDDVQFDEMWGLDNTGQTGGQADADIDAPEAWDVATGSGDIVVGVIDTGIDYTHEDLAANVWTNPGETPDDGIDNDGNGYVDDVHGWDFVNDDSDPLDDNGHGTHTSGTIAAMGNNATGVVGVNWDAQVMALKFLNSSGNGSTDDAVAAINYATMMRNQGVNLVLTNNSWSGGGYSQALYDAIEANGNAGMLFVGSAGNNNSESPAYPAGYDLPNIISVAATDHNDAKADFSNYGASWVDLGAPGVDILSTLPGNGYGLASGTSMAAPHVAGVAALAWSTAPAATPAFIKGAILDGVDPVASMSGITLTGGRLNAYGTLQNTGMTVKGSSPPAGQIVTTPPTEFVVDFAFPVDSGTVHEADFEVNGTQADSFDPIDADTIKFIFDTSPVSAEGVQTMHIDAGAVATTSGIPLDPLLRDWTATFRYDANRMQVVSIEPAAGSTATLPLTSLTVTFNEAFDPGSVGTDDVLVSQGSVVAATPVAGDPQSVEYTLSGIVSEAPLAVVMPAGALTDGNGNPTLGYNGTIDLDFGTVPLPAALELVEPLGSLIYTAAVPGSVSPGGDTDSFTLDLEAGQTVAVLVEPDGSLQPTVEVLAPGGLSLGSAAAAAAGEAAVLQPVTIAAAGTYTVTIGGVSNTVGAYSAGVTLNAALETESNDTIPSAQPLDDSFIPLASGAERAAVVGGIEGDGYFGPDGFGYAAQVVPFEFEDISSTGNAILVGADSEYKAVNSGSLTGFEFSFYGATHNDIIVASNGTITFEWDRRQGTIYNGWFLSGDLSDLPAVATIAPFWDDLEIVGPQAAVYWEVRGSGTDQRLIVQWDNIHIDDSGRPSDMVFQAVLYESNGSIQFNYQNIDNGFNSPGSAGFTVGIKDAGVQGPNRLLLANGYDANQWVDTGVSTRIAPGIAPSPTPDYYAFHLDAGQDATLALTAVAGGVVNLEIQDSGGTTLEVGSAAGNTHAAIEHFVAPAEGLYYAVVSGGRGLEYSLVATRGAGFDLEGNNDFASAQDITGLHAVLGAIASADSVFVTPGSGGLDGPLDLVFGPDGNLYVTGFYDGTVHGNGDVVHRYDGVTGAFLDVFARGGAYGEGLVFGPDGDLYFADGSGTVFRFDGATGEVVDFYGWVAPRGLAFGPDGYLYVASNSSDNVGRFDVDTGELIDTFVPGGSGGLDFAWDLVFGADGNGDGFPELLVSSNRTGDVLRYDGATGAYIDKFVPAGSGGLSGPQGLLIGPDENGDGIGELYVAAGNVLRYDGATGAFLDEVVAVGAGGLDSAGAVAFGPDGSLYVTGNNGVLRFHTPQRDLYEIDLAEGEVLDVATSTPLGALNGFDPMIRLYDASGTLLASDDNSAADGRNPQLTVAAPPGGAGTYYVEVLPSDQPGAGTDGEYVLTMAPVAAPGPVLFVDGATALEGDGGTAALSFTVTLSTPADVTVDYAVEDGTATSADNDYVPIPPGTLTFTAGGPTVQTIEVAVNGDTTAESHETLSAALSNAVGATIAFNGRATGTILNDDTAISVDDVTVFEGDAGTVDAVFTVSLSEPSGQAVTVDYATADGTATEADSDYQPVSGSLVFQPGETSKTIAVPINGDTKSELDESFLVNLSKPVSETAGVTIDDAQGIGTITGGEIGAPIAPPPGLLSWWTGDGNADDLLGVNNGTLTGGATYSSGNVAEAFSFDGADDYLEAPTTSLPVGNADRTIELWVNADSFPSSGEAFFAGYGAFGSYTQTYQLGTSGDRVFFSQWGSAIFGPSLAPGQWYHVAVTNVGGDTTLYLDGTAVASGSFTIDTPADTSFYMGRIPGTLGDTRKLDGRVDEVSVYDRALTADEVLSIYRAGAGGKIKGPGITVTPTAGLTTTEAGGTDAFSVVLNTAPLDDVTIPVSSSDTSEGTAGPTSLTFTPLDWYVPQTVTVTGVDDPDPDGDVSYAIVLDPASSTDGNYDGLDPADVSVTNQDDDAPSASGEMFVGDIAVETRTRGKGGSVTDARATVLVESDTDGNGVDEPVVGVNVTVVLSDSGGIPIAAPVSGTTDAAGQFTTTWFKDVPGTFFMDVTALDDASGAFTWNPALDQEDDSNSNVFPDDGPAGASSTALKAAVDQVLASGSESLDPAYQPALSNDLAYALAMLDRQDDAHDEGDRWTQRSVQESALLEMLD